MGGTLPARLKDHLSVTLSEGHKIEENDALLYRDRLTAVSVPSKVSHKLFFVIMSRFTFNLKRGSDRTYLKCIPTQAHCEVAIQREGVINNAFLQRLRHDAARLSIGMDARKSMSPHDGCRLKDHLSVTLSQGYKSKGKMMRCFVGPA
ncbi:hypothetical protein CEXT_500471 [Caerostris extrusa]|uniref:Uncharacterized protein n=1 Tax=Caerostris extrusa TaxID=172846 RepID=A0AAV4QVD0_CAEEX|nr:hypothetical protein CEXT_500471 [Caerostris extrusa]